MASPGRIQRRLALAIVLTALIPLLVAVWLAETMLRQSSERFFVPEIGDRLDESLGLYQELARSVKAEMRGRAELLAADPQLARALGPADAGVLDRAELAPRLRQLFAEHDDLIRLAVEPEVGPALAEVTREQPLDAERELELEVRRPLAAALPDEELELVAVFGADAARFGGLERMSEFVDSYARVAGRRSEDRQSYLMAFAALLGLTLLGAVGVGSLLARSVSRRLGELAAAARQVGGGDLAVRVPASGSDEIAALAKAFNRMLDEVELSRARIEYLQRIGAWQDMARRLAHEIKNPLTPIQLAVQEIHERYADGDPAYRKLLDTTLEIVEQEVGTLRRLVTEFSDFARLPAAHLEREDLVELLREEHERGSVVGEIGEAGGLGEVELDLPAGVAEVAVDRQLLHRVLVNLVSNARDAQRAAGPDASGVVRLTLSKDGAGWAIDVDDDGPGVPKELRERIFDPYVTTKTDGTGLGLAIVKKIIVEHGGTIGASDSPLGGARVRIRLPAAPLAHPTR